MQADDDDETPPPTTTGRYRWGPEGSAQRRLDGEVTFGDIHVNNIGQLRKLNEHAFPLTYADKFYQEIPTLSKDFTQFAYFGGFAVGAVCGRLEPFGASTAATKKLYIMTIGVLVAYRQRGIGRTLLRRLLDNARDKHPEVAFVYLHVQTSNDAALEFYRKAGFQKVGMIRKYYKRIDPPDCFVLCKLVHYRHHRAGASSAEEEEGDSFSPQVKADIARAVGVDLPEEPETAADESHEDKCNPAA